MDRLPAENRKAIIVSAAVELANREGLASVNHSSVAKRCTVKTTVRTIRHYFPRITNLWSAIILDQRSTEIVRQEAEAMGVKK